ncbi:hypothetical protein SADUNF_Sadunf06G0119000 [Salix dunnii]|uniref:Uncharacterized protein n=1 Tax=Salix dunnii TaxID=1413687 RepID=A0A835K6T3_9ROSI|nr:hypothetical protein SADUNF_Sadunf06G0119000 [Salix dunnii]
MQAFSSQFEGCCGFRFLSLIEGYELRVLLSGTKESNTGFQGKGAAWLFGKVYEGTPLDCNTKVAVSDSFLNVNKVGIPFRPGSSCEVSYDGQQKSQDKGFHRILKRM